MLGKNERKKIRIRLRETGFSVDIRRSSAFAKRNHLLSDSFITIPETRSFVGKFRLKWLSGGKRRVWNVGMMECWKRGFQGMGLMYNAMEPFIVKKFFVLKPIIPLFQFSIIFMVSPDSFSIEARFSRRSVGPLGRRQDPDSLLFHINLT